MYDAIVRNNIIRPKTGKWNISGEYSVVNSLTEFLYIKDRIPDIEYKPE